MTMRNSIFLPGAIVSLIYLYFMHRLIGDRYSTFVTMDLNTVGDFLAGAFSPLAFFWLVLGFIQQGRELNISSKALQAQADELKHSVDQHKDLVNLTRSQLELEREDRALLADRRKKEISPFFEEAFDIKQLGDSYTVSLSFTNKGPRVTKVMVDFTGALSHLKRAYADWKENITQNFLIPCNPGDQRYYGTVSIKYFDIDQNEGVRSFNLQMQPPSGRNVTPNFIVTPAD